MPFQPSFQLPVGSPAAGYLAAPSIPVDICGFISSVKIQLKAELILCCRFDKLSEPTLTLDCRQWLRVNEFQFRMYDQFRQCNTDRARKTPNTLLKYAKGLCNKPCGMYFTPATQQFDRHAWRNEVLPVFFESIWQEWMSCEYGGQAGIECDRFFTRPMRGETWEDPSINGIVNSHKSVARQAPRLMRRLRRLEVGRQLLFHDVHPLFRALVVIADNVARMDPEPGDTPRFSLHRWAERQTVLLVRTGSEELLSAPISFESLKAVEQPLGRADTTGYFTEVIRVPLTAAVQFVATLEVRENHVTGETSNLDTCHDGSLCPYVTANNTNDCQAQGAPPCTAKGWADRVLSDAYEIGFDNSPEVVSSKERVQALLEGENSTTEEHSPFDDEFVQ